MAEMIKKSQTGNKRSWWRTGLMVLLFLILLLGAAGAILWYKRYEILQIQGQKKLAELGFDGKFTIKNISRSSAILEQLQINYKTGEFVQAKRLRLDYQWRDALGGKFEKITIIAPKARIKLDAKGRLAGLRFPASGGGKFTAPPNGIFVKEAVLDIKSPYGEGKIGLDLDYYTNDKWTAQIKSRGINLFNSAFGTNTKINTNLDMVLEKTGDEAYSFTGEIYSPDIKLKNRDINNLKTSFNLNYNQKGVLTGWARFYADSIYGTEAEIIKPDLALDNLEMLTGGNFAKIDNMQAEWKFKSAKTRIKTVQAREQISGTLMALGALKNIPIAKEFAGQLQDKADGFLRGFELNAKGNMNYNKDGYKISLSELLKAAAKNQTLIWQQNSDLPAIIFDKQNKKITAMGDMSWSGNNALSIRGLKAEFGSNSGFLPGELLNIAARIASKTKWKTGKKTRLAPFDIDMKFGKLAKINHLQISGAIDYDGPVPGGEVSGLKAGGKIDMALYDGGFDLDYMPASMGEIKSYTNISGWQAKDLSFIMPPAKSLLKKRGNEIKLAAILGGLESRIVGPQNKRHLDAGFLRLAINADLSSNPQNWQIDFENADIRSENFPAPGTRLKAQTGRVNIKLQAGEKLQFDAFIPKADLRTDNIHARNTDLKLQGYPDNIDIDYISQRVKMKGDIPALPARGSAKLQNGILTGAAISKLPQTRNSTQDTPIKISYRSEQGIGTADIDISSIRFSPEGLQPQYLIPALRGRIADVSGIARARFRFEFGGGRPVSSSGWAKLVNMDIGTLVGPLKGVNLDIELGSVFPLKTTGVQEARIDLFDPGIELKDGIIKFELLQEGVDIKSALWPVINPDAKNGAGKIYTDPVLWKFGPVKNKVKLYVENISLDTFMAGINEDRFYATGQINGVLPIEIEGVNLRVNNGVLRIDDGGIIRFRHQATDAAGSQNKLAGYAFEALKDFRYRKLEARLDGPLGGQMQLNLVFDGKNPEVLGGQTFLFDTKINGELANLVRNLSQSFSNNRNLSRIIEIAPKNDKK